MFPSLPAFPQPDGRVLLTRKYIDGVLEWEKRWGGPVTTIMRPIQAGTDNLDGEIVDPKTLPIHLIVDTFDSAQARAQLASAKVVVGMLGVEQNHLPGWCKAEGIPLVTTSEYSLRTRLQIAAAEEQSPFRRLKRSVWECKQEIANLRVVRAAAGIQCNGTPTFDIYRHVSRDPLLFFDTRVTREMLITADALRTRLRHLESGGPLRLAFSGRLNHMKGADDLIQVARELRALGVPFRLDIAGGGALEAQMRSEIDRLGLSDVVALKGVLDFGSELIPWVKESVDLYVFCHRQGDPSCTYFETMSCGVPFVGYDNEALHGIVNRFDVGRASPMGRPALLAKQIADIYRDRAELVRWSERALQVASEHTFEASMDRRGQHLRAVAARAQPGVALDPRPTDVAAK